MEQQFTRPDGLIVLLRIAQFIPYVAIGLLVIMIAIWIIFGMKKFRWAKILAIVLTVLVLITGICSFIPYIFRASMRGQFPQGGSPHGDSPEGEFPRDELPGDTQRSRDRDREDENLDTGLGFDLLPVNYTGNMDYAGEVVII